MQYTIRNIPAALDKALRKRAKSEGRSLNDVALDAMTEGLRLRGHPVKYRDLSDLAGRWIDDPAFDEAMKDFERINPELWGLPNETGTGHEPVHRLPARRAGRRRSA
jgi:plasmid stability protein